MGSFFIFIWSFHFTTYQFESYERQECVQTLFHVFQPWSIHITIAQRLSRAIREGYVSRNPIQSGYANDLNKLYGAVKSKNSEFANINLSNATAPGFSIIGYSGMGKTSAVDRVLATYPQEIFHSEYKNQMFPFNQIVWMKLVCPYDGSIKGLCSSFFAEFDRITGDNTYQKFSVGRNATVDSMVPQIALIARRHALGALIIDEIQHLKAAKSGGIEKMLNFIVNLVNIIGIPVILIGTPKALDVLNCELMQARRNSGQQGAVIMDNLKKDSDEWKTLMLGIWHYQWTKNVIPLTKEINDTIYDESLGIVDLAVKLFAMTQLKVIEIGKDEAITPELIKAEAKSNDFALYREIFAALRKGTTGALGRYDDLVPISKEAILLRYHADNMNKKPEIKEIYIKSTTLDSRNSELQDNISLPKITETKKDGKDVNSITKNSTSEEMNKYETLKIDGVIVSQNEEF